MDWAKRLTASKQNPFETVFAETFARRGAGFWSWQKRIGAGSLRTAKATHHSPHMGYKTELRNGTTVDSQRIKTFYDAWLKPLFNRDPNLAAQLYFLALDDEFSLSEENTALFIEAGFLELDGGLDPDFRNVILSAIAIDREHSELTIERPEKPKPEKKSTQKIERPAR
jgi:hypothetical protein